MPKSKPKKVDDVAQPGTTAPSATSRPVIVTNRSILKDPMVVEAEANIAEPKEAPSGEPPKPVTGELSATAPLLKPDKKAAAAEQVSEAVTVEVKTKPETETAPASAVEPAAEPVPEQAEPESKTDQQPVEAEESTEAAVEAAQPATAEVSEDQAKAQAEHEAAIDKLVESKKYFLPINSVEKRKSKRFVMLGILLSLLLIVAWADIALDAGLIKINGLQPLTHFFSS